MANLTPQKKIVNDFNNGVEFINTDTPQASDFNNVIESQLYSQNFAEYMADTPDVSEWGNVGVPNVQIIDNVKNGITYKKLKFLNGKGDKGDKGDKGGTGANYTAGNDITITGLVGQEKINSTVRNYINLNNYIETQPIGFNYTALNAKILEYSANKKGATDRANIYFYNSGSTEFLFSTSVVWQSNCNYYFLNIYDISSSETTKGKIALSNISNCAFIGFSFIDFSDFDYVLSLSGCTNISFESCKFTNFYAYCASITNCNSLYFENCELKSGNYTAIRNCVSLSDTDTTSKWIMFENCRFNVGGATIPYPYFVSTATNSNLIITLENCIDQDQNWITTANISKGLESFRFIDGNYGVSEQTPTSGAITVNLFPRIEIQTENVTSLTLNMPTVTDNTYVSTLYFTTGSTITIDYSSTNIIWRGDDCAYDSTANKVVFTPIANRAYTVSVKKYKNAFYAIVVRW